MQIRRILVPVDFSQTSEHALDYAVELAKSLSASLHLVHVWQMPVYAFPDGGVILGPDVVTRVTSELQKQLDAMVARHAGGVSIEGRLAQGIPDSEIGRLAGELACDLVVVGTHGRTGLSHLVLGSVAERVVRASKVPVLTIPRAEKSE